MLMKMNVPMCLVVLSIAAFVSASEGGYEENSYDQPPSKMKFNIGFNLPSMSISLPKLELPQISIKASVKNKKPFTLKLPVIKFNGYANSEEDNSYGGGHDGGSYNNGGNQGGSSYNSGPSYGGPAAYASGSGATGYVSATPDQVYSAPAGPSSSGYDRPSAPAYISDAGQYTPNEPAYASSGYSAATQSASSYQGKAQQAHVPQAAQYHEQPAYQIQNAYQAPSNVYSVPSRSVNSYSGNVANAAQGNSGYYVSQAVNNHHQARQQVPSYREEPKPSAPVHLYQGPVNALYQGSNPYDSSSEATSYNGPSNGAYAPSSFNRRTNRMASSAPIHYPETFKSYETSASLPEGRYVLAPFGDDYKWQPLLMKV